MNRQSRGLPRGEPSQEPVPMEKNLNCDWQIAGGSDDESGSEKLQGDPGIREPHNIVLNQITTANTREKLPPESGRRKGKGATLK